jgi:tripartite-type tricarboxylate transporter receptor subunit TctC
MRLQSTTRTDRHFHQACAQASEQSMTNPGFVRHGIAAVLLIAAIIPVWSQSYPSRPITIVVPLAAGTGMDTIARLYGEKLAEHLGRPVVVENKPGGGFLLATQAVIAAPADGHTLLVGAPVPLSINQALYKQLPYNPEKDLIPIAHYAVTPFILVVTPSLPIRSVPEFINYAKERLTPMNYSSPAGGGVPHYAVELIKQYFGLQLNHIPYRNSPQSIQDIAAGHVDLAFAEAGVARALIQDGKLRALAVSSKQRMPALPDIPTFAEVSGMSDFEIEAWHMLVARAVTPQPIVNRLNAEMKRIMAAPDMKQRISDMGLIPLDPAAVAETERYVKSETAKWSAVLKSIGLAGSM